MTTNDSESSARQIREAVAALRSDDALVQNDAVERLIQIGEAAVPELLSALPLADPNHAQAMYALSQIGDSRATELFKEGLSHHHEHVRAFAAIGLANINHPDALSACLQTINDGADEVHMDMTPAAFALGDMGLVAVPSLLDLFNDDNEMTRLHAQRALGLLINKRHGFIPGRGFPSPEAERAAREEWRANGDYDYSADAASRRAAIDRWQQWLESATE